MRNVQIDLVHIARAIALNVPQSCEVRLTFHTITESGRAPDSLDAPLLRYMAVAGGSSSMLVSIAVLVATLKPLHCL